MAIPIIVLTNGRRDCITLSIASAIEHLTGAGPMTIVNDAPDPAYGKWLDVEFVATGNTQIDVDGEHGYSKAMRVVWDIAADLHADSFLLLEDDFTFNADVDLTCLARVLDEQPHLTQLALLRQPWFGNEVVHGGLIEALEAQGQVFAEHTDGRHFWVEHRAGFTGNPTLIPKRTFTYPWPEGAWSESRFGRDLFEADKAARGAYWGRRSDAPRVTHIGHERVGQGY